MREMDEIQREIRCRMLKIEADIWAESLYPTAPLKVTQGIAQSPSLLDVRT